MAEKDHCLKSPQELHNSHSEDANTEKALLLHMQILNCGIMVLKEMSSKKI